MKKITNSTPGANKLGFKAQLSPEKRQ